MLHLPHPEIAAETVRPAIEAHVAEGVQEAAADQVVAADAVVVATVAVVVVVMVAVAAVVTEDSVKISTSFPSGIAVRNLHFEAVKRP